MTHIRDIHGTNFWWAHRCAVRREDERHITLDVYRYRCGLSQLVPFTRVPVRYNLGLR